MEPPRKPTIVFLLILIILVLAALACIETGKDKEVDDAVLEYEKTRLSLEQTIDAGTVQASAKTQEAYSTYIYSEEFNAQQTADIRTRSARETLEKELEGEICGVIPQKVTCEGNYTFTITHSDEPAKSCSFNVPFRLAFWNVGAHGLSNYNWVDFYWSYVDFQWSDCSVDKMTEKSSLGEFSGGPNGHISAEWASIQINAGQTGTLSYSDADETMSGTCTILNPSAFTGWDSSELFGCP